MSIANTLYDDLAREIDEIPLRDRHVEDVREEVILPAYVFDVPPLDEFMNPDPDVIDRETTLKEKRSLLGSYRPMRSPGEINLYRNNLRDFFWSLISSISRLGHPVTKPDLRAGLWLTIIKTYNHEIFHYYCDVLHKLFGGSYVALEEEALAVAWSRLKILHDQKDGRTTISNMAPNIFNLIIAHAFQYKSPGYIDWQKYPDEQCFKKGFGQYIHPPNYNFLQVSDVLIDDLLFAMLEKINHGFDENLV